MRAIKLGCVISALAAFPACQADISGNQNGPKGSAGSANPNGGSGTLVDTDGDGIPDSPAGGSGGAGPVFMPGDPNAVGPMPLRRLNRREYNNTVRDLFGVADSPANAFPSDADASFPFPRAGMVAITDAEYLQESAEKIAAGLDVTKILPCQPASGEPACAKSFIETFGLKMFRRPLLADETTRLTALYDKARGELKLDFNEGIKLVVEGMLQAPGFIYRWELGPQQPTKDGMLVKLTPFEVASRISYFLLRSTPDQALMDAAKAGTLSTDAEINTHVERLLAATPSHDSIISFFGDWLKSTAPAIAGRNKDLETYPEFLPDLQAAMAAETDKFVGTVLFGGGDATLTSLLTSPATSVSGPLAKLYGVADGATTLNAAERSGLLTRAAFLTVTSAADGSNPVKRGKRIYEGLMCKVLVPPSNVEIPPAAPPSAGGTTRDRFSKHSENPCAACHKVLDPLGFGFENYDGIGKFRSMDNGLPVNAASVMNLDGVDVAFNNGVELSAALAKSDEVRACFATHWLRYALDRNETTDDSPSIQAAVTAFKGGNYAVPALIKGVAAARSFRFRTLAAGEIAK